MVTEMYNSRYKVMEIFALFSFTMETVHLAIVKVISQ